MNISSRKQLLDEAEIELQRIKDSVRKNKRTESSVKLLKKESVESDLKDLHKSLDDKLNAVAEKAVKKQNEIERAKLEFDLENFRKKMEAAQRLHDQGKPWTSMSRKEKAIKNFEMYYKRKPNGFWDKVIVDLGMIADMMPGVVPIDSEGNIYNPSTGEKMTHEEVDTWENTDAITGIDKRSSRFISGLIQALTGL